MSDNNKQETKELEKRIIELESLVKQKQFNIDFLNKMIEIAEEQLGIEFNRNAENEGSVISKKKER